MKSILNPQDREEILGRISRLTPDTERRWGKMNVNQAICHITDPFRDAIGERETKQIVPKLFGPLIKRMLLIEKAWKPNSMTLTPYNQTKGTGTPPTNFEADKRTLVDTIHAFVQNRNKGYGSHPAAGNLSEDEWGKLMYKHVNHHLEQFGL